MKLRQLFTITLLFILQSIPISLFASPQISVNPLIIETDMTTGEVENLIINISNEGDEDLLFSLQPELVFEPDQDSGLRSIRKASNKNLGPQRDNLGDVIAEYYIGEGVWVGLAWNGELMYGIPDESHHVRILNPITGEIEDAFLRVSPCYGFVYQDPFFWSIRTREGSSTYLIRFNRRCDPIEATEMGELPICGLAADGEHLYYHALDPERNRTTITQITPDCEIVREIDCSDIFQGGELSLEWVEQHDQGHLWAIEWESGTLSQLDISGREPEMIQRTQILQNQPHGMAHDGENLWYSTGYRWKVIDDGILEIRWLRYEVDEDILEAGSETEVRLSINATDLIEGDYSATLLIMSNDPDRRNVVVTVDMNVTGIPALNINWSNEFGWPDLIDWNEAYIDVFTAARYSIPLTISNPGTGTLIIESISCENRGFLSNPDNLVLTPGEESEIEFLFNAVEPGEFAGNMVFEWNSLNGGDFEIRMTGTAVDPPVIRVEPMELGFEFEDGERDEAIINILNEGASPLRFNIRTVHIFEPEGFSPNRRTRGVSEYPAPCRDDLGDIIEEYAVPEVWWTGLAWDGEFIWGISSNPAFMFCYNPETQEIIETIDFGFGEMGGGYTGLTYDGQSFWAGLFGRLYHFDRNGSILGFIEVPGESVTGVTIHGDNLWYYAWNPCIYNSVIRQISTEGELLREVDCTDILHGSSFNLVWVPEHNGGNLWVLCGGHLFQLDISRDQPEVVQEVEFNFFDSVGITHDGTDLWFARHRGHWCKIDDGISENPLISINLDEGEIEPGSDMDVTVSLEVEALNEGEYETELQILSNDPVNPDMIISINVSVTGNPTIQVDWPDDAGWPDIVDWNLFYDELFTGVEYPISVNLRNCGTANLLVEEVISNNRIFSVDQDGLVIPPGEKRVVTFVLNAHESGIFEVQMVVVSNDLNNGELNIPLNAEVSDPPQIEVIPDSINSELPQNESEEHAICLYNDGLSTLRFFINHKKIDEPDQNSNNQCDPESVTRLWSGPNRDDMGDLITEYNLGQRGMSGIAYDGELIWFLNRERESLFSFNQNTEEIVDSIGLGSGYQALDFDGEFFWVGCESYRARIKKMDRSGRVLRTILIHEHPIYGISHDGENLWINSIDPRNIASLRKISTDGDLLRVVDCCRILESPRFGLEWVPDHENGHIWIISHHGVLAQLNISSNVAGIIQRIDLNLPGPNFIDHDGDNLWIGRSDGLLKVIEDGIIEKRWLTYEPVRGEIEPQDETDIFLTFDATRLEAGDYSAELHIRSNDPDNPDKVINVFLDVEPNNVENEDNTHLTYHLSFAYPNPFNSTTIIKYTVPLIADVNIKIYDINGHLITTLVNESKKAGTHEVIWDGSNYANGLYMVRFESGNYQAIRKVTLLK